MTWHKRPSSPRLGRGNWTPSLTPRSAKPGVYNNNLVHSDGVFLNLGKKRLVILTARREMGKEPWQKYVLYSNSRKQKAEKIYPPTVAHFSPRNADYLPSFVASALLGYMVVAAIPMAARRVYTASLPALWRWTCSKSRSFSTAERLRFESDSCQAWCRTCESILPTKFVSFFMSTPSLNR